MTQITNPAKDKIITEFETMESLELSAADLYTKIAADPDIKDESIKTAFKNLARDEHHHAKIVRKIINLAQVAL